MSASIAIVIPWFGPWPAWMPAFLRTCRSNGDIAFIIPSDTPPPPRIPDNVLPTQITFDQIGGRAARAFGRSAVPTSPYKLCDFKPLYGELFRRELDGFDFWGHADLDILWGNIRGFITPDITDRYDVICGSDSGVIGHFTLYRRGEPLMSYLRNMPGLKNLLAARVYRGIDELWCNAWLHGGMAGLARLRARAAVSRVVHSGPGRALLGRFGWYPFLYGKLLFFPRRRETGVTLNGRRVRIYKRQLHKSGLAMHLARLAVDASWNGGTLNERDGTQWMYLHFQYQKRNPVTINFSYAADPPSFVFRGDEKRCDFIA